MVNEGVGRNMEGKTKEFKYMISNQEQSRVSRVSRVFMSLTSIWFCFEIPSLSLNFPTNPILRRIFD